MIRVALIFLIHSTCFAFVTPESFDSGYITIEDSIFSEGIKNREFQTAKSSLSDDILKIIFDDKNDKIRDDFEVPKYFDSSVRFWFSIYTQYSSKQVVIHDMNNLKLVYNVIDYSGLHSNTGIHRFSKSKLQSQLSLEYTIRLKKSLKQISKKKLKQLNPQEVKILNIVKEAGINVPLNRRKRKKLFLKLANSLRTQTGQRDKIYKGVVRSLPYQPYLKYQLKNFNLPEELIAIAFLESSFNPIAKSKVAASGVWQFMPYISNLFLPRITKHVDYRSNPVISSIGAFHLLKENKVNMRRWDLAVTAYNSGTKHLKRAIKKFARKKVSLEYILKNYDHPHLGFASKNFYSEFLALVRVLAYEDIIYPLEGIQNNISLGSPEDLNIYVTKCRLQPKKFYRLLKKNSPIIHKINSHFESISRTYPRGMLVVSDRKLTSKKYYKVPNETLIKKFPKFYPRLIKNKKCNS